MSTRKAITFRAGPFQRLNISIIKERTRILIDLFRYANKVCIPCNIEDVNKGIKFAIGKQVDYD